MAGYLEPADVAERWKCSPEHVRRQCKSGQLAAMKLGRVWRIKPEAVEAYERRHTSEPAAPEPAPVRKEAPVTASVSLDGWRPEKPRFPALWGLS